MATCAATGETFEMTELTGVRTAAISAATSATFDRTAANCTERLATAITQKRGTCAVTSATISAICAPTVATFGMTAVTSGTIAATSAATAEGRFRSQVVRFRLQ